MMRRPLAIALVAALAAAGGVDAKPKQGAKVVAPASQVPAPQVPASFDRFDPEQFKLIVKSFGWKPDYSGGGSTPYVMIWSPLGMPYLVGGVQCPDGTGRGCEAIRLRSHIMIQRGDAAGVAQQINAQQFFLRGWFEPDSRGGAPYLFPERTIILKGGVTPAQIEANLTEFDRWVIEIRNSIGEALPASYTGPRPAPRTAPVAAAPGSGLMPGRYRTTITNSNGTFSEDICMTASDMREPINKVAADLTNGGSGCSISGSGGGSVPMQCTGRIVEGNISASGMSTSLRWTGNALINTDGMGGRDRIQFQASASRIGDC